MMLILIFSLLLNILFIFLLIQFKRENDFFKCKTVVSNKIVYAMESAMMKAIDSGDVKQYKTYKELYDNLMPKMPLYHK